MERKSVSLFEGRKSKNFRGIVNRSFFSRASAVLVLVVLLTNAGVMPTAVYAQSEVAADENVPQTEEEVAVPPVAAPNAVLLWAETGEVLFDKDKDVKGSPASVTKIMTAYVALKYGNLEDVVTMTGTGTWYVTPGSAHLDTVVGEQFTLEQLLYGTLVRSANDMATQIAEYLGGGSVETFVAMMNKEASEMGCTNTHFANACGWPDENNYSTAYDLAIIMSYAIQNETFCKMVGSWDYTIPPTNKTDTPRVFSNHVALLCGQGFIYDGIIGGKTGYTDAAQNNLVCAATRDGRTLICAALHTPTQAECAIDNVNLLNYGYDRLAFRPKEAWELPEESETETEEKAGSEQEVSGGASEPSESSEEIDTQDSSEASTEEEASEVIPGEAETIPEVTEDHANNSNPEERPIPVGIYVLLILILLGAFVLAAVFAVRNLKSLRKRNRRRSV